jgi:hypothetical protein
MTDTVALVLGGSNEVFTEYVEALKLCAAAGMPWKVFACNDMLEDFPDLLENGVTLHPEKLPGWLSRREAAGRARPTTVWGHRGFANIDQWTRDWQGSVGLFAVKIAREERFRKIICCGVPMDIEANHFKRKTKWVAALGFRRGWTAHRRELAPFVRSMSGWTKFLLGPPTIEWLLSEIPDPNPPRTFRRDYHAGKA